MFYLQCAALQPIVGYHHNLGKGAMFVEPGLFDGVISNARRDAQNAAILSPETELCNSYSSPRLRNVWSNAWTAEVDDLNSAVVAIMEAR